MEATMMICSSAHESVADPAGPELPLAESPASVSVDAAVDAGSGQVEAEVELVEAGSSGESAQSPERPSPACLLKRRPEGQVGSGKLQKPAETSQIPVPPSASTQSESSWQ
jgi:hypothetical protein